MMKSQTISEFIENENGLYEVTLYETWKEDVRVEECHGFHTFIDSYDEVREVISVKLNNIEIEFDKNEILKLLET